MIHPNELRIGNFILDEMGRFVVVNKLEYGDRDNIFINAKPASLFYGLLITRERLEGCGFEKYIENGSTYYKKHDTFHLKAFNEKGDISYECGNNIKGNYSHFRIDHIHQLQNLYFALTGKELDIKL